PPAGGGRPAPRSPESGRRGPESEADGAAGHTQGVGRTDRDRHAPRRASNPGPPVPPAGAAPPNAQQDPAPRGDGPPMPVTLATLSPDRPPADHPPPPTDRGRAWLARLAAGGPALPAVVPAALPPADRGPAEHDAVA